MTKTKVLFALFAFHSIALLAADPRDVQSFLDAGILEPGQAVRETASFIQDRVPRMPSVHSVAEWKAKAGHIRRAVLDQVVFRGEAAKWRDAHAKVEWMDALPGGPGYRIRTLRYEALPGLWVPALLYEPDHVSGKVPVALSFNGHASSGKAVAYKQLRCINLVKRGMIVLSPDFLGLGQLDAPGFDHERAPQLDLCGTSGVAPFYLAMKRALDILVSLPAADTTRVAVAGLSGGGWQTIFISSLDTRVTLANPVAGYESLIERAGHPTDVGCPEQAPSDIALFADYAHLTALLAPRPLLLTYNAYDDCCFVADFSLPRLLEASRPIFSLFDRPDSLRFHINYVPGTHNFETDNREAFYDFLGDFFFAGDPNFNRKEIPSEKEIKTPAQISVPLPDPNQDFHSLALALSENLPQNPIPSDPSSLAHWRLVNRTRLGALIKAKPLRIVALRTGTAQTNGLTATFWKFRMGTDWTAPAVELTDGASKGTALIIADAGKKSLAAEVTALLRSGRRVIALDPFYIGVAGDLGSSPFCDALLIDAVGERPLGIQASQISAAARWIDREQGCGPVSLVAVGPRMSFAALAAAALEEQAIASVELNQCYSTLKDVIARNATFDSQPELFCFGLLQAFDVPQLETLVAPRPVSARRPPNAQPP